MSEINYRAFSVDGGGSRAVLASENPVMMFDWSRGEEIPEVLAMSGMRIRGERDQIPLLDTHARQSIDDVLGSARNIEVDGDRVRGEINYDDGPDGAKARRKVEAGHVTDLSIGYRVSPEATMYAREGETIEFAGRTYPGPVALRTSWEMHEVSLVPIGADEQAKMRGFASMADAKKEFSDKSEAECEGRGVTRACNDGEGSPSAEEASQKPSQKPTIRTIEQPMNEPTQPVALSDEELRALRDKASADARTAEVERIDKIRRMGDQLADKHTDDSWRKWATTHIDERTELRDVEIEHRTAMKFASETITATDEEEKRKLNVPAKDMESYSIVRAIRGCLNGKLDGIEGELSREIENRTNRTPKGFFLPSYDLRTGSNRLSTRANDANTGTDSEGGYLVGTDHRGDMFIELLRNRMALPQTGMRTIGGLRGDVAIPSLDGAATAYWLTTEATAITDSLQTFGQQTGEPHELGASVDITKKLLAQSSPDVEMVIRDDIARVLAIAKDNAGLEGTGSAGEPLGITGASGIGSVSIATSNTPTWAEIVEFETDVATANADAGSMAWVFSPAVRGNLKTIVRESGQASYLMNDNDTCNGYPVVVSNQLSGDLGLFGNFSDAMFLDWDGVDVVVDELSLSRERLVRVTMFLMTDVIVRHGASFSLSAAAMA